MTTPLRIFDPAPSDNTKSRPSSHPRVVAIATVIMAAAVALPLLAAALMPRLNLPPTLSTLAALAPWACWFALTFAAACYGRSRAAIAVGTFLGLVAAAFGVAIVDTLAPLPSGRTGPLSSGAMFVITLVIGSVAGLLIFALGGAIAHFFYSVHGPRGWAGVIPRGTPGHASDDPCGKCGYLLQGLPLAAPCPECGATRTDDTPCKNCGGDMTGLPLTTPCRKCGTRRAEPYSYPHRPAFPIPLEKKPPG